MSVFDGEAFAFFSASPCCAIISQILARVLIERPLRLKYDTASLPWIRRQQRWHVIRGCRQRPQVGSRRRFMRTASVIFNSTGMRASSQISRKQKRVSMRLSMVLSKSLSAVQQQRRCHPHFRRVRVSLQEYVPSITPFRSLSASAKHMATTSAGMPITRTGGRGAIRRGRGGSSIVVCRPIRPELTPPPSPEHTRRIPPATEASHGPRATRAASCFFNHRINRMQGVFLLHRSAAPAVLQLVEWSDAHHLQ